MACVSPAPGTRLFLQTATGRFTGTIGYVGPLAGLNGVWIGVDWDDSQRGKHDGTHNGIQYFHCRLRNAQSGSFIRPSISGLSYGRPFLEALSEKYIDHTLVEDGQVEEVILGSSHGAIRVEAPKLSQVRHRLSNLGNLRFVSLDGEGICSSGGMGSIIGRCDSLVHLDLSHNLISSWKEVLIIVSQLPKLQVLLLNHNRLAIEENSPEPRDEDFHFLKLQELHLNDTLVTSVELSHIDNWFPALKRLQLGKNSIKQLDLSSTLGYQQLEELNLDSNLINDWATLMSALRDLPALKRLLLPRNEIAVINLPKHDELAQSKPIPIKQLSVSENQIRDWSSVDALPAWLSALEELSIQDNPISTDPATKHYRSFIIARIPTLLALNGSSISAHERKDSELLYMAHVARSQLDPTTIPQHHPQWKSLIEKHGIPEDTAAVDSAEKLAGRTFELFVQALDRVPIRGKGEVSDTPLFSLKVLPSMTLKILRLKIVKMGKFKAGMTGMRLWAIFRDSGAISPKDAVMREMDDPSKPLEHWGLGPGCGIGVLLD